MTSPQEAQERARARDTRQQVVDAARDTLTTAQAQARSTAETADDLYRARLTLNPYLKTPEALLMPDHYEIAQLDSALHREWMRHRY